MRITKNTVEQTCQLITEDPELSASQNQPKRKMSKLSKIILSLSIIVFFCSAAMLVKTYINRQNSIEMNSELYSQFQNNEDESLFNYDELKSINPGFVGWIYVPNTNISLPVVKYSDNSFYLKHDFYKKYDYRGTVFMDCRNNEEDFDTSTILYGHNCYDGTMFSDLEKFKDIEFYKTTPVIEFHTQNSKDKWKVYAVFITSAKKSEDNGYIFNYIYPFLSGENFTGFINEVNKRRLYETDVDITDGDNILILSTCVRDLDIWKNGRCTYRADARLVVVSRKLRPGESDSVNVDNININSSPKYPQVWYDKHGIKNPYVNDEKWYPQEVVNK